MDSSGTEVGKYEPNIPMATTWPSTVAIPVACFTQFTEPYAFTIYSYLVHLVGSGETSPSSNRLAELTGISRAKIIEVIKTLVKDGYIHKCQVNGRNEFRLLLDPVHEVDTPRPAGGHPVHEVDTPPENITPLPTPATAAATTAAAATTNQKNTPSICLPLKKPLSSSTRMTRPTIQEVTEYMLSLQVPAKEGEKFHDFYEAGGWTIGKNKPMKSWEAACRNWKRNYIEGGGYLLSKGQALAKKPGAGPEGWQDALMAWCRSDFPDNLDKALNWAQMAWKDVPAFAQQEAINQLKKCS